MAKRIMEVMCAVVLLIAFEASNTLKALNPFGLNGQSFDPSSDLPNLSGKVIVVTGGTSGLGAESILQLAKHDALIYLTARDAVKAEAEIAKIKAQVPHARLQSLTLDLSSFTSIKAAVDTFVASSGRLDILMNNAGIMATPPGVTSEGYEIQFGTNYLGHALFTMLLLPTLERTAEEPGTDVRIINLSSSAHQLAPQGGLVLKDTSSDMAAYNTWTRYGQSKLANILFTTELAKRHPTLRSVAIHPGGVNTNLNRGMKASYPLFASLIQTTMDMFTAPVNVGARNQLWAVSSAKAQSGRYYDPVGEPGFASSYSKDGGLSEMLWEWAEDELVKHGYLNRSPLRDTDSL